MSSEYCDTCERVESTHSGGVGKPKFLLEDLDEVLPLVLSSSLLATSLVTTYLGYGGLPELLAILSLGTLLWIVASRAYNHLLKRKVFDENFLVTIASTGAVALGLYLEAAAVTLLFSVGEYLQESVTRRSRKKIRELIESKPVKANLLVEGGVLRVDPKVVQVGSKVSVNRGDVVPLDGVVIEGSTTLDESPITGESTPREVSKGSKVFAGSVNLGKPIVVKVTRGYEESVIRKVVKLIEEAERRKSPIETQLSRFAKYYTPSVVATAAALAFLPPLLFGWELSTWAYRALVLLVISCPCGLVLSVPLTYFSGLGKAAKSGVLVKGANYLELLSQVKAVALDKTRTLTKGTLQVVNVVALNGFKEEEVLNLAATVERYSTHPVAEAIRKASKLQHGAKVKLEYFEEVAGYGVKALVNGREVLVGNDKFLHKLRIPHERCDVGTTAAHVVIDGKHAGYIVVSDELKEEAGEFIAELKSLGVERVVLVTGDTKSKALEVSKRLGIHDFISEALPQDKLEVIRDLRKSVRGLVAFIGDGINDGPALAEADIGIAMGGLGTGLAIEVADVVVTDDDLRKVIKAVKISRKTKSVAIQNIVMNIAVKAAFITLGALGLASIWGAVFSDSGIALISLLNSLRVLRVK